MNTIKYESQLPSAMAILLATDYTDEHGLFHVMLGKNTDWHAKTQRLVYLFACCFFNIQEDLFVFRGKKIFNRNSGYYTMSIRVKDPEKIHRGAAFCRIHAAQVCDAREDDSSTAAG